MALLGSVISFFFNFGKSTQISKFGAIGGDRPDHVVKGSRGLTWRMYHCMMVGVSNEPVLLAVVLVISAEVKDSMRFCLLSQLIEY